MKKKPWYMKGYKTVAQQTEERLASLLRREIANSGVISPKKIANKLMKSFIIRDKADATPPGYYQSYPGDHNE